MFVEENTIFEEVREKMEFYCLVMVTGVQERFADLNVGFLPWVSNTN
jgi:hypothetical protein